MKKLSLLLTALTGLCTASFAQVGSVSGCTGAFGLTKIITGKIKSDTTPTIGVNTTWSKDTIYIIKKIVRVGSGATLTMPAGTIMMGFPGPLDTSALVINRGAKLNALGTATNPVVMTSCKIQGSRNRGDWGGLVILGRAINNIGSNVELEGGYSAFHGGNNPEDNSGQIQYLRVEFAGIPFALDKEVNGITLGSVGARTIFQFVQVSNSGDDSFEWFGGSVNGRNLISWKPLDDDFDTDNGYSGLNQFGIAYRDYAVADQSGSNAFESDNNATGSGALPKTTAIFSNFTAWGPLLTAIAPYNKFFKTGAIIRRNSEQDIYNSLFIGWPGDTLAVGGQGAQVSGLYLNNPGSTTVTTDNAAADLIRFKVNYVTAYTANPYSGVYDNAPGFNSYAWFNTPSFKNTFNSAAFPLTKQHKGPLAENPNFALVAGAALLNGSSFQAGSGLETDLPTGYLFQTTPAGRGFGVTNVRGAISSTEWTEPWAEFNPNLFKYTSGIAPTRKGQMNDFLAGNGVSASSVVCSPNPAVSSTEISFINESDAADASVSVLDMSGNNVLGQSIAVVQGVNYINLNTASLNPGTYVVRVSANGTVAKTTKLSVVR